MLQSRLTVPMISCVLVLLVCTSLCTYTIKVENSRAQHCIIPSSLAMQCEVLNFSKNCSKIQNFGNIFFTLYIYKTCFAKNKKKTTTRVRPRDMSLVRAGEMISEVGGTRP